MKKYDLVIKNGQIVDGTGKNSPSAADLAVKDGIIAKIGVCDPEDAGQILDAGGRYVTPGFIDLHSHGDSTLIYGTDAHNQLEQGITTELCGQCGESPVPYYPENCIDQMPEAQRPAARELWDDYQTVFSLLEKKQKLGANVALVAAHGAIRGRVMGFSSAQPTPGQLDQMRDWVRQAMECGCYGLSTGLIYPPSCYAGTEEIEALCRVVSEYDGIYLSHIRGESHNLLSSVAECVKIGESCGVTAVVSHHKVCGRKYEGSSVFTLKMIDDANARGAHVRADQYPFTACATGLIYSFPPSYLDQGIAALVKRLEDPGFRAEARHLLAADSPEYENMIAQAGFDGSLVVGAAGTPQYIGKTLAEVAQEIGHADPLYAVFDLLRQNSGIVEMAFFTICESDMNRILTHPCVMAGTDWFHNRHQDAEQLGGAHPRGTGTFPRHLRLVREGRFLPIHKAIYRVTGLPAQTAKIEGRGVLREGNFADICVLDWENLREHADFLHPFRRNEGLDYVLVNGQVAVKDNAATGVLAGRLLRKNAR